MPPVKGWSPNTPRLPKATHGSLQLWMRKAWPLHGFINPVEAKAKLYIHSLDQVTDLDMVTTGQRGMIQQISMDLSNRADMKTTHGEHDTRCCSWPDISMVILRAIQRPHVLMSLRPRSDEMEAKCWRRYLPESRKSPSASEVLHSAHWLE